MVLRGWEGHRHVEFSRRRAIQTVRRARERRESMLDRWSGMEVEN